MALDEFLSPAGLPVQVSAANPLPTTGGGGGSTTANQGTANTAANAWPVIPTSAAGNEQAISAAGNAAVAVQVAPGAAFWTTGQVTAGAAGTLVAARATRRFVTIKNTDAAITVYVGPATVTSTNGMPLKAGESMVVAWTGLIQVLAASGSPVVAYSDQYD